MAPEEERIVRGLFSAGAVRKPYGISQECATVLTKRSTKVWPGIKKLWGWLSPSKPDLVAFPQVFEQFQALLENHQQAMELIADLGEKSGGDYIFDRKYLFDIIHELQDLLLRMVKGLNLIASNRYYELYGSLDRVFLPMEAELRGRLLLPEAPYVISLKDAPLDNPELTGGQS